MTTTGSALSEWTLGAERLLADTLALPESVRAHLPALEAAVDTAFTAERLQGIGALVLAGSGDLLHAALAAEMACQRLTGLATQALPSMAFGLYRAPTLAPGTAVIQMSFSGKTARAVEAAAQARAAGARLWALTAEPDSPLAAGADHLLLKPATGANEAAGFPITMLLLYLAAVRIALLRGRIDAARARALRATLAGAPADMAATLAACRAPAEALAGRFAATPNVLFVGSGPSRGAAENGAARVLEAMGANAAAQDVEEWVHLNRWVGEKATPCFVIAPPGPSRPRAAEILDAMRTLGRPGIAIAAADDRELGRRADAWLPVTCALPEAFSPLVYSLPGELFAHLSGIRGGHAPYRGGDGAYARLGEIRWGGALRDQPLDPGL